MGTKKNEPTVKYLGWANGLPEKIELKLEDRTRIYTPVDDSYYLSFQFCSWLENLDRGSVSGATKLLRKFFAEKGLIDEE